MKQYVKGIVVEQLDPNISYDLLGNLILISILMGERKIPPYKGFLDFIGGSMKPEDNKNPLDAMKREAHEEAPKLNFV